MRKLILWSLAAIFIVAGGLLFWLIKAGGGDDPSAGDEDLIPQVVLDIVPAAENGLAALNDIEDLVQMPDGWSGDDWPIRPAPPETGDENESSVDAADLFYRMQKGEAWDEVLAAAVLERNERVVELVREALARPKFQIPPSATEYHVLAARDAAIFLEFRSLALARDGRTSDAVEAAMQPIRLGRRLYGADGDSLNYLVAAGVQQIGLRALRSLVPRLGPGELRRLSADLEALRPTPDDFRRALRGEYGYFVFRLDAVEAGKLNVMEAAAFLSVVNTRGPPSGLDGLSDAVNEAFLTSRYYFKPIRTRRLVAEAMRILLEEVEKPVAERTRGLSGRCGVTFANDRTASNGVGAYVAAAEISLSERWLVSADECEADFSATRVLLALQAYRLEAGTLPPTLAELVPRYLDAVPRDPFDGAPLRYSREKLRVWSVGRDLEDSGGGELGPDGEWSPSQEDEPTYRVE
jgi:hypothetical protein